MIKLALVNDTETHVIYNYYVEGEQSSDMIGTVQVFKSNNDYNILKRDNSPFSSACYHAVRFAMNAIEDNNIPEDGIVAWY